jgi:hypothetical protein
LDSIPCREGDMLKRVSAPGLAASHAASRLAPDPPSDTVIASDAIGQTVKWIRAKAADRVRSRGRQHRRAADDRAYQTSFAAVNVPPRAGTSPGVTSQASA